MMHRPLSGPSIGSPQLPTHFIPKYSSVWYSHYIVIGQFIFISLILTSKFFILSKMNCTLHLTDSNLPILLSQGQHHFFPIKLSLNNVILRLITPYCDFRILKY